MTIFVIDMNIIIVVMIVIMAMIISTLIKHDISYFDDRCDVKIWNRIEQNVIQYNAYRRLGNRHIKLL